MRSGGPKKPSDLLTRNTPPAGLGNTRGRGAKAPSPPAEAEDTGECTCGEEIGKKLEDLVAGRPTDIIVTRR